MYEDLIEEAHKVRNCNTKYEHIKKPSLTQEAAFAALEAAIAATVAKLAEARQAFLDTLNN